MGGFRHGTGGRPNPQAGAGLLNILEGWRRTSHFPTDKPRQAWAFYCPSAYTYLACWFYFLHLGQLLPILQL